MVRAVKTLRLAGLSLAILLLSAQVGAARPQRSVVEKTASPIWTLAVDGSRVAYASGGLIHVWNLVTDKTSSVRGKYSNAQHTANASQLAIAEKRVAWIKAQGFGNTEEGEKLYTAPIGGRARQVMHVYRYGADDPAHTTGGWIQGLVGSGNSLAVSTWESTGTAATDQQLSLVTGNGLRPLAGGAGAIVSQAIDGNHIADLQSSPWSPSTSVSIYSTGGDPLNEFSVEDAHEVALTGNLLAVLAPSPTPAVEIYDWTNGTLLRTFPAQGASTETFGPHQVGHVEAYGGLVLYSVYTGYIGGYETVHVLDPATGKDAFVAHVKGFGANRMWALGSRGLVYVVNSGTDTRPPSSGKLVFVPKARLEALLGQ
jgi:hypothetical protein